MVFALLEEVKSAVSTASCTFRDVPMTLNRFLGFKKKVVSQKPITMAVSTFHCSKKDNKKGAQTCLRHYSSQLSTSIGRNSPENTDELSLFFSVAPHTLVAISQPPSWRYPAKTTTKLKKSAGWPSRSSTVRATRLRAQERRRSSLPINKTMFARRPQRFTNC